MVALTALHPSVTIRVHTGRAIADAIPRLREYATRGERISLTRDPGWLNVLANGFGHTPHALEAVEEGRTIGYLPLAFVRSLLFGKFLVSLPYLNSNGLQADTPAAARALVNEAVRLADNLKVRHLELRHETAVEHPAFNAELRSKVHMRLQLPETAAALSKAIGPKVRNQIRKGEKSNLTVEWGGEGLISAFHEVFARNMRDLGTPVYGQSLLRAVTREYSSQSEICVVRHNGQPVAAALLLHGNGVTEVPSASCLREFNPMCANMLMYWHLLERAVQRGQQVFDFGRSTVDCSTYKFKLQWGAKPEPAVWQYYARRGSPGEMRPDNPKYQRLIRIWQRLPVSVTRWIGPKIARGIP